MKIEPQSKGKVSRVFLPEREACREKLEASNLLSDAEIRLIVSLRYAEDIIKEEPWLPEPHLYRVEVALNMAYESHYVGTVMTEEAYEVHYSDYSDKERAEIDQQERVLYPKLQPLTEQIVKWQEELAEIHKPKPFLKEKRGGASAQKIDKAMNSHLDVLIKEELD